MEKTKRILIVEDEGPSRELLGALLSEMGYEVETARDGFEALAKLKLGFDLVLLDLIMPGMDGFEVTRQIRDESEHADVPVLVVTALHEKEHRLRAVEAGANDFIAKPVDKTELKVRTASLLRMKEAHDAVKHHQAELEQTIQKKTADLRQVLQEVTEAQRDYYRAQIETIERLGVAAEYKDEETGLHIKRMSGYCHTVARKLKLAPHECETIQYASPMHDVGKIGIPEAILLKPGKLDAKEWETMKRHPAIGAKILSGSSSELLQAGEVIALSHHEKWDGSGYPAGLAGEAIPLWGRICAVADVFDALTSKRPYREALPNEEAVEIMQEGRASHFDPQVLDVFLKAFDEAVEIQQKHREA